MKAGVRSFTVLLASYYILALGANTPDLKEIKSKIEVEIEVEKIKNKIVNQLRTKGAQVDFPRLSQLNPHAYSRDSDLTSSRLINNVNAIPTHLPHDPNSRSSNVMSTLVVDAQPYPTDSPTMLEPKAKPLIVIGEPRSKSKKDKCLNFRFGKYMKTDTIVPIRMNLWIYLRVHRKGRKKNKNVATINKNLRGEEDSDSSFKNSGKHRVKRQQNKKKNRNRKKNKKKRKNKNRKKNKRGRKVKIFVSDVSDHSKFDLVIMRMRVKQTNWYMLELPISQFPSIINSSYTRTLCIKCKRCNKKIKIDLRKRTERILEEPTVPFIHIEPLQTLPHSIYRQNERRRRDVTNKQLEKVVQSPCCREDVYTIDIAKDFPNVLHPLSINITLCTHISRDDDVTLSRDNSNIPLLSQHYSSISNQVSWNSQSRGQCHIGSRQPLTLTFLDKQFNVRKTTIDHLLPVGCHCTNSRN